MAHDDRACEQRNYPWKSKQLSDEIGDVPGKQDQTGLFDGVSVEGLVDFEEIAETEPSDGPDGDTEKHEDEEFHDHVHDCVESAWFWEYVMPLF